MGCLGPTRNISTSGVGARQHLKPGISELQPRRFVVGLGCVFSLASAFVRVLAVFFKFVRRNDLLRVFQQVHYGRRKRSKDGGQQRDVSHVHQLRLLLLPQVDRLV
jgi:hypothetical protein